MRITSVNNRIYFGRALKPQELEEFNEVRDKAKQLAGQNGKSVLIVHDTCLPQSAASNTGVGNLSSKDAKEFFSYMKPYLGFNAIKVLPAGEVISYNGLYCAYAGTALSLGSQEINPELLTTDEFANLLKPEEYEQIVKSNTSLKKEYLVNYKNVVDDNSPQDRILKIAYNRFKALPDDNTLKKEYLEYVRENNDWLEPKGIYRILMRNNNGTTHYSWDNPIDKYLYDNKYDAQIKADRINQIAGENKDDIEFYKFKQFLADKHLAIGKKNLNDMGVQLIGDCEINYSADEVWANPYAFKQGYTVGAPEWGAPCLDYDAITNPDSAAAKLLKRKVQLNAKRYDAIRFDVGWAYVFPRIFKPEGGEYVQYMGDSVFKLIENAVKEVKGQDYNLNNLMYECDGANIFKDNSTELMEPLKGRVKIFNSTYTQDMQNYTWGTNDGFLKLGWSPDEFIIGVGNHDPQPLRQMANSVPDSFVHDGNPYHKTDAIEPLSRILKLDKNSLENPVEFAKAKWAEPMSAKNNFMFYMDVFGRGERFDVHDYNLTLHPEKNYAYKIPANYKALYHEAVQEGYGFNIMDALQKTFKAKGLDIKHPDLYNKIIKFRDILNEKDIPVTKPETKLKSGKNITNPVKKNKYLKPILILTGLLGLAGVMALYCKKFDNGAKVS